MKPEFYGQSRFQEKRQLPSKLSRSRLGRALLHVTCLLRGGRVRWHLLGIRRELIPKWFTVLSIAGVCFQFVSPAVATSTSYSEPFRPQFHFTPQKNWMNDPNGMLYYENEYHLFYQYNPVGDKWGHMSWGHAISTDLVHWKESSLALAEADNIMIFSGSAVVDWKNTSGFGKNGIPPMVAIYTGNHTDKPLQNQNLAYSNDRGRTWTKYSGNPVLDVGKADFRDPKVFWHEPTRQWIMVVALPTERKVQFYGSPNLKHWELLGDFGPAGATAGVWECPDLFPLPVDGDTNHIKWVLIVNTNPGSPAGGSGCQYFIGEFDGSHFTLDASPKAGAAKNTDSSSRTLADFEGNSYGDWKTTGTAFGTGPSHPRNAIQGYQGNGLADSFGNSDKEQGTLTSPEFTVDANYLGFLIGGGNHPNLTGVNLLINGQVVRTATGNNSAKMRCTSWNVKEFRGQKAQVQIFDRYSGNDWGHIFVDHVVLQDQPIVEESLPELWIDYGRDFYAGVTWSDIPKADGRRILLGWMNNWDYGQDIPTSPWRSAMTIPRVLSLQNTSVGLRLVQSPVHELAQLQDSSAIKNFTGGTFAEASAWLNRLEHLSSTFKVEISFDEVKTNAPFGLAIQTGLRQQITILCDPRKSNITIDRTRAGLSDFHIGFAGKQSAPLRFSGDKCTLTLFLDTSSLEVFAQNGEVVLTDQFFAQSNARSISLVSRKDKQPRIGAIKICPLLSAWAPPASQASNR